MFGTFSGGGLGMGIAFTLKDEFSKTADEIERKMGKLGGYTEIMANKINRSMDMINLGAGMTAIGAVILSPFLLGIKHASDLEENINKVDVAFGNYADNIKKFSNTSLDQFGVDKIQALDMAALFGDMGTGMGMAQEDAASMSQTMVGLAGDIASFKNLSHDRVQTALKGVFTGETETLKNLGIVMTQTELQAFAASKGINKAFKSMTQQEKVMLRFNFVMDRSKNALGDFVRTGDGFANRKRKFLGAIREMSAELGSVLMPIAASTFGVLSKLLGGLTAFAKTKAGKVILSIVAALGAFLVVGGLALMLTGGMRFAIYKMAGAFGTATKATLIQTIATNGATAGLRAMAVAAWASLGPFLLIAAVVVAIGAGIYYLVNKIQEGFKKLDEWDGIEPTGGTIEFFMKVAGVLRAVGQIWSSFTGDSFSLTKELADKLEALGILGFVLKLGTFIVRVKTIFNGFVKGLRIGFSILSDSFGRIYDRIATGVQKIRDVFGKVFDKIWKAVQPLVRLFHILTGGVFENAGALDSWGTAANILTGGIIIAFEVVAMVLETIIDIIVGGIETMLVFGEAIYDAFGILFDYSANMFTAGVNFATALWDGIKSMWGSITTWMDEKIGAIFTKISQPFKWVGDKLGAAYDFVTGNDDEPSADPTGSPLPIGSGGGAAMMHENSSKSPMVVNNTSNNNTSNDVQPLVNQIYLDGDLISESMLEALAMKQARG